MIEFDDWSVSDLREKHISIMQWDSSPIAEEIMSKRRNDGHHSTGCPFYKVSGQSRGK